MSALIAAFSIVFLRAMQQQNVIHGRYSWAAATSYLIAIAEVGVVLVVVKKGWPAVPWVGTGGAIGVTLAMLTHRKFFHRRS